MSVLKNFILDERIFYAIHVEVQSFEFMYKFC